MIAQWLELPAAEAVVALARELVRIPTANPPGNEEPCVRLADAWLRGCGFTTTVVPYGAGRAHVVGRRRGSGERPGLLFSGHVDVVPPGEVAWQRDPFSGVVEEGRLWGRGACDMKGGVAALLVAAREVARTGRPLRGDLAVAITADEERGCLGAMQLAQEPLFAGLRYALVAEPSALDLFLAEKGGVWLEVTMIGRTAHGSMPECGANAIAAMADLLVTLEREIRPGRSLVGDVPPHPLLTPPTLSVGTIHGGVKTNVVADRCVATLDFRVVPGLAIDELIRRVDAIAQAVAARRPGIRYELATHARCEPVASPQEGALAQALIAAHRTVTGAEPRIGGVPYVTEACVWVPVLGMEMAICGPGDPALAHQPDEFVPVSELQQAVDIYRSAAETLLT